MQAVAAAAADRASFHPSDRREGGTSTASCLDVREREEREKEARFHVRLAREGGGLVGIWNERPRRILFWVVNTVAYRWGRESELAASRGRSVGRTTF